MNYLVFVSQNDANAALAQIDKNMGFPSTTTLSWAQPLQRLDNNWCYPCPPNRFLTNVQYASIETYSSTWFPPPAPFPQL